MSTTLTIQENRLRLSHDGLDTETLDLDEAALALFRDWNTRYQILAAQRDEKRQALLQLGSELGQWLNQSGWLERVLDEITAPWLVEIEIKRRDRSEAALLVLNAPWELLAFEGQHLAFDPMTVYMPVRRVGQADESAEPSPFRLNVLFMAASPVGQHVLAYEAEELAILQATERLGLDLRVEESGSLAELSARAAQVEPDVVHLSCHGGIADGTPQLCFESELGELDLITAERWLQNPTLCKTPRLVFLSACHSAEFTKAEDSEALASNFALDLLRGGVSAVLGWGSAVSDAEASEFSAVLYEQLVHKVSLVEAVGQARAAVYRRPNGSSDWHLARLFLSKQGGGVLSAGDQARLPLDARYGEKAFLDKNKQVPVAGHEVFVGRRRQLQRVLKAFRASAPQPVLVHGMGRQGKSSLAARVGRRLPELKLAVVYGQYYAEDILQAFKDLGEPEINKVIADYQKRVEQSPELLAEALHCVLSQPCAQALPVLLVIDDLEQILEPQVGQLHRVKAAYQPVLRAVLQVFQQLGGQTRSRLLLTSRYQFTVLDGQGRDLAAGVLSVPLPAMDDGERVKQWRLQRQVLNREQVVLEDTALVRRCLSVAQGNPALQDKLYRLARLDVAQAGRVLEQVETWLKGGDLPTEAEEVRKLLEGLVLGELYGLLTPVEQALLQAGQAFTQPLPCQVLAQLADQAAVDRLLALGLWDGWPDVVVPKLAAAAVNRLAVSLLQPLAEAEVKGIAERVIVGLWDCWGQAARSREVQFELTRLGVLAGHVESVRAAAGDGLCWAYENLGNYPKAAALGQQAVELLQAEQVAVDEALLLWTARSYQQAGQPENALQFLEQLAAQLPETEQRTRAVTLGDIARIQVDKGNIEQALSLHQERLSVFESLGDLRSRAVTLGDIARIQVDKGNIEQALSLHQERLSVFESLGDLRSRAVTLGDIARIQVSKGNIEQALSLHQERLSVFESLGDLRERAVTLGDIARIQVSKGNIEQALSLHQEMLTVFESLGDLRSRAVTLGDIARIQVFKGNIEQALSLHQEMLTVFESLGDLRSRAVTLGDIARIQVSKGNIEQALSLHQEMLTVFESLDDLRSRAVTLGDIADIAIQQGDLTQARQLYEEKYQVAEQLGDNGEIAHARWSLGKICVQQQDWQTAADHLSEAYQILMSIGRLEGIVACGLDLGQLLLAADHTEDAQEILQRSYEGLIKLGRHEMAEQVKQAFLQK